MPSNQGSLSVEALRIGGDQVDWSHSIGSFLMTDSFPNDADGDALRRVVSTGSDMSKRMFVDFQVAVPSEASATALADVASKLGYRVAVYDSLGVYDGRECSLPWTCECSTRMLVTYESVIAVQQELREISAEFGGHPDRLRPYIQASGPTGQPPVIVS